MINLSTITSLSSFLLLLVLTLQSSHPISYWLLMELTSLFFFLYLITTFRHPATLPSLLLFLIIQSLASILWLLGYLQLLPWLTTLSIGLKLGLWPLNYWYLASLKPLAPLPLTISLTVSKLPTLGLLSLAPTTYSFLILMLITTSVYSMASTQASNSLTTIVIQSSIFYNGWFVFATTYSFATTLVLMGFYFLALIALLTSSNQAITLLSLATLSGLPPLPLFFVKLYIVYLSILASTSMTVLAPLLLLASRLILRLYFNQLKSIYLYRILKLLNSYTTNVIWSEMILTTSVLIYSWTLFLLLLLLTFLGLFAHSLLASNSYTLLIPLHSSDYFTYYATFYIDTYSALFSSVVLLITISVFNYTPVYFHNYSKLPTFLWITFLFVASILLLINIVDPFSLILGWDGLGFISFLLILYYLSPISSASATATLLINRIGDSLLILSIVLLYLESSGNLYPFTLLPSYLPILLLIGLRTKSALFPFSPWLPLAIAAPTPIRALVHSSTLVTAGLFLLFRWYDSLAQSLYLPDILLYTGLLTSFYAGLQSLYEPDLKKLIALSTLRHLGFMAFSLGINQPLLAYFHLLSHALFKSSLFISFGYYIRHLGHSQDSRYLSNLSTLSPFHASSASISIASLLGFPFLSGFYSKDYILEAYYTSTSSSFYLAVVGVNLLLTYYYSLRLLSSLTSSSIHSPYISLHSSTASHFRWLSGLSLTSMASGFLLSGLLFTSFIFSIPNDIKLIPFFLLVQTSLVLVNLPHLLVSVKPTRLTFLFANILHLRTLIISTPSRLYLRFTSFVTTSIDYLFIHLLTINTPIWLASTLSGHFIRSYNTTRYIPLIATGLLGLILLYL